jgi:hypothetical protein
VIRADIGDFLPPSETKKQLRKAFRTISFSKFSFSAAYPCILFRLHLYPAFINCAAAAAFLSSDKTLP